MTQQLIPREEKRKNIAKELEIQIPTIKELGTDLRETSRRQLLYTLSRPFIGLLFFMATIRFGLWYLSPVAVFLIFVAVVTATHDIVHKSLSMGKKSSDFFMFFFGAMLLESGHAYRITHKQHHKVFPGEDDPEGDPARMSFAGALLHGIIFLPKLWVWAYRRSAKRTKDRIWLLTEAAWFFGFTAFSIYSFPTHPAFLYYTVMVIIGSWVYPISTVYLPHDAEGETKLFQTKTLRGRIIPTIFLELTYHLEHHLYPEVPSHNLAELSRRLIPFFEEMGVEPVRTI